MELIANYKFKVTAEMKKLREWLDKQHISWEDLSDKPNKYVKFWVCRTRFLINGTPWSVIHGFGTYGGYDYHRRDLGALELMSPDVNGGEPVGYLSADNVIEYIKKEQGDETPEAQI